MMIKVGHRKAIKTDGMQPVVIEFVNIKEGYKTATTVRLLPSTYKLLKETILKYERMLRAEEDDIEVPF